VHWFFGFEWRAPMVIVVLASFGAGCAIGVLAMVPRWWRQRRVARQSAPAVKPPPSTATSTQVPSAFGAEATVLARLAQETYGIRLEIFRQAWTIATQHPWFGVGAGQFAAEQYWIAASGPYVQPELNAHNVLLQLAVDFGWPAAAAALALAWWWGATALRVRLARPELAFAWAVMLLLAIHSLLEYPLWYLFYAVIGALLFGLAEPQDGHEANLGTRVLAPAGLVLLLLAVVVKIDADRFTPTAERFWGLRAANLPIDAATRRAVHGLGDDVLFVPQYERMLLSLDTPNRQQGGDHLALCERVLSRLAQPEVIARYIFLLAQAGRIDEAVRHVDRLRIFGRQDYPRFRDVLLAHLPPQDAGLAALRQALLAPD
jgi:hypothetical protein